jgi:hypothetical protein
MAGVGAAGQTTDASQQILEMQQKMQDENNRTQLAMQNLNRQSEADKSRADAEKTRHDILMGIAGNIK